MGQAAKVKVDVEVDTKQAGADLTQTGEKTKTFGSTFKGVFAGVIGSNLVTNAASKIFNFGKQSLEAYDKSTTNAVKYADAMKRIPGASAANTAALTDQAKALSKVTQYGTGATKSGQAILAGFHLTAAQIKTLTPLMQDYAAKTGKDIPTAATDLGKALLGQTRSLKTIGITIAATSSNTKAAVTAQHQYTAALKGVSDAQNHLKVVQGEVASGQLTGKAAASALTAAHARLQERELALTGAHNILKTAQAKAGTSASNYGQIVSALQGKVGGLATQMGETAPGRMAIMNNQITALKVSLGSQLAPIMEKVVSIGLKVIDWLQKNADIIKPLVVYLGAIVAIWKLWNIALAITNAIMAASPIGLIVIGIVALGIALIIAYQKVGWFRDAVNAAGRIAVAAFNAIFAIAKGVFSWLAAHWPLIIGILVGPLGVATYLIIHNWSTIVSAFRSAASAIAGVIGNIVSFFARLPGQIGSVLAGIGAAIAAPFIAAFNYVKGIVQDAINFIGGLVGGMRRTVESGMSFVRSVYNPFAQAWNSVHVSFTVPKGIPVIGGKGINFSLPQIPLLAGGAWITGPTFAMLGEGREGEIVAPESKLRQIVRQESGTNVTLNINVPPSVNKAEVGREVAGVLRAFFAAGGRLTVPA